MYLLYPEIHTAKVHGRVYIKIREGPIIKCKHCRLPCLPDDKFTFHKIKEADA